VLEIYKSGVCIDAPAVAGRVAAIFVLPCVSLLGFYSIRLGVLCFGVQNVDPVELSAIVTRSLA
jgi:hypothetical protein